eukprot:Protomagalhaensia_wolfi_Nauph_80__992@NODE_1572_length_1462_cov_15_543921_g1218_i0_p1_GENE_NODE_1572_length_1462_cov_15_543921_g1218_i0NODE_1572_length_1462_cov_15_543921_g1218_i0_p1_ORF_typecomplete_len475_score106_92_NODE_1572_length_1462_cov_15_543921_g1218_i0361460
MSVVEIHVLNGASRLPYIGESERDHLPVFWSGQVVECEAVLLADRVSIERLEATFRGFSKAVSREEADSEMAVDIFYCRKLTLIQEGKDVSRDGHNGTRRDLVSPDGGDPKREDSVVEGSLDEAVAKADMVGLVHEGGADSGGLKFSFRIPYYTEPLGGDSVPIPPSMKTERGEVSYCVYLNGRMIDGDEIQQIKIEIHVITWSIEDVPEWKTKPTLQLLGQIKLKRNFFKEKREREGMTHKTQDEAQTSDKGRPPPTKTKNGFSCCSNISVRTPKLIFEVSSLFPTQLYFDQEFNMYLQLRRVVTTEVKTEGAKNELIEDSSSKEEHEERFSLLIRSVEVCLWQYTILRIRMKKEIQSTDLGRMKLVPDSHTESQPQPAESQPVQATEAQPVEPGAPEVTLDGDMISLVNGLSLRQLVSSPVLPTFHTFAVERWYSLEMVVCLVQVDSSKEFKFDTHFPIMILPPSVNPYQKH